jgi:hypothetical protein
VGNSPTNLTDPSGENPAGEAASVCLTNATISGGLSFLQQRLAGRKVNWGWGGVGGAAASGCLFGVAGAGLSSMLGRLGWTLESSVVAGGGAAGAGAGGSLSGAALARAGVSAEELVATRIGIGRNLGRVRIPGTGRGGYRVLDFDPGLTIAARHAVVEVKDVARLKLSPQLRDMVRYAQGRGVPLEIFTNGRLPRSGQLADWIAEGVVVISPL